jgi:hypothetical protein
MNGHDTGLDESPEDLPDDVAAMSRLLRYERHLEGDAFTAIVMAQAALSRRRRGWILSGFAAVSAVCVVALMPADWVSLSLLDARVPWRAVSDAVASLPVLGVAAGVVLLAAVLGFAQASEEL